MISFPFLEASMRPELISPQSQKRGVGKLLIMPKFQLLVIGINLSIIILMSLIVWMGTRTTLADLAPVAGLSGIEVTFYKNYLSYQASSFQLHLFIAFFAGIITSTGLTLVITHRISGPMLRMRAFFQAVSEGQKPTPQLEFRDGDYFGDLPTLINKAVERLETQQNVSRKETKKAA